ncbi:DMT family transporter [Campylobacter concisus]|uniref:DMT family transporter n=1 Tax=Campylobacter concisus TaxID=199 RepID=UPI000D32288B|nr:SMR family transporter [Campylobacter concisus]
MIHVLALLAAGCCEVSGVFFLTKFQKSVGVKKAANFLILTANFALSLWLLSYAMQAMAMSVAYAIWTGIGAIGAVLVGVAFNNEKVNLEKALFLSLIIISAAMLKIV